MSELTVSQDGTTVIIRNAPSGGPAAASPLAVADIAAAEADAPEDADAHRKLVRSPVSGIAHQSNSPGAQPLVKPGDAVEAGQGLCIVEAMKVFTTVPAPFAGVVRQVLFQDGQEVDAGQPLVELG
ncbi:acetyl-CoA carboxylase biotin carboxyl carrier protein [Ectorhizobium quercum]|uniref:acetyl-CoA carboxylase biotin carboxyl carrier protein n=1 Tax=Ectorhizobium quercum TaxID=2965071 RepID=UPI002795C1F3|nr:acetyl-CoA carboxylase biotin carboxyl carrier protein subunit [Ectorhizobium quercum]